MLLSPNSPSHQSPLESHIAAEELAPTIFEREDREAKMRTYRNLISDKLRNYTCEDPRMESSVPIHSYTLTDLPSPSSRSVFHFLLLN